MTEASRELLAHRVAGAGEPLLLLNGIAMSMSSWEPAIPPLAARYSVVRCDLRGQLLSPGPPPDSVVEHVPDVIALLDHLEISRCHILATSFGGAVGALLAARHPDRVRSLISVASADGFTAEMAEEVKRWRQATLDSRDGPNRGLLYDVFEKTVYSPTWVAEHASERDMRRRQIAALPDRWFTDLAGLLSSADSYSLAAELGSIRCPTLILAAQLDGFIPAPRSRALSQGIPGSVYEVMLGVGHAAVAEQPQALAQRALEFLHDIG